MRLPAGSVNWEIRGPPGTFIGGIKISSLALVADMNAAAVASRTACEPMRSPICVDRTSIGRAGIAMLEGQGNGLVGAIHADQPEAQNVSAQ